MASNRDSVWCVLVGRRRWQLLLEMIKDIVPFQGSKKEGELSKDVQTNFMENRKIRPSHHSVATLTVAQGSKWEKPKGECFRVSRT